YKRCCIDKPMLTPSMMREAFEAHARERDTEAKAAFQILKKYNAADVFKVISYLHFQPTNHGKNIRLENLLTELVRDISSTTTRANLSELLTDIKEVCTRSWAEDPPEEFFTENIIFENDNHIVFPGISAGATEIVQGLIHAVQFRNGLPEAFKTKAKEGLRVILSLHTGIAQNLGFAHRMFEDQIDEAVTIPEESLVQEKMSLFSW